MIDVFVSRGADIEHPDRSGRTLLSRAASARDGSRTLVVLLAAGADPNIPDDHGWTALHWATVHGYGTNAAALITYGANADLMTDSGLTPASLARRNGHIELAESFGRRGPHGLAISDLEANTCNSVRHALDRLGAGAVSSHEVLGEVLGTLERFIPQALSHNPRWEREELDGIVVARASVHSATTLEMLGTATLLSTQRCVPLYVLLAVPAQGSAFERYEIRLGEVSGSGTAEKSPAARDKLWKRLYVLDNNADAIDWAFTAVRNAE